MHGLKSGPSEQGLSQSKIHLGESKRKKKKLKKERKKEKGNKRKKIYIKAKVHKVKCLGRLTFSMQTKYGRAKCTASPQTKTKIKH